MGKAERNKKQKKDALLNTAFELFTSKGITDTTISNIVDRAGVAKGTFYLYFKDKYDIRNKLIAHKASQVFTKAEEALHQTDITSVSYTHLIGIPLFLFPQRELCLLLSLLIHLSARSSCIITHT